MIKISGIYTIRDTPQPYYWDIVFEWEDQMAKTLGLPLVYVGKNYDRIYRPGPFKKVLNRLNAYQLRDKYFFDPKDFYIAFHIGPPGVYSFFSRYNVIPIIIDFWRNENVSRLESIFRLSPLIFVTNREVFNYLKEIGSSLKLNHLSLSIPDRYLSFDNALKRDIDIIQIGRSHQAFDEYMRDFLREFSDIHYVSAEKTGNELKIISSKFSSLGTFRKREDFIHLLKRSRISLVSAPGLDEDRIRTGGFSPVTPRFLESAACGCKLIGIYPENADFKYYGMDEVCKPVNSYDQFKKLAVEYLSEQASPDHSKFLEKHLTSKRAHELINKIESHG